MLKKLYNTYSNDLNFMYGDSFNLYRFVETTDDYGFTVSEELKIKENIKCKFSSVKNSKNSVSSSTLTVNPSITKVWVFCSPDVDIFQGDVLELTTLFGKNLGRFVAGASNLYLTHQQLEVIKKENS